MDKSLGTYRFLSTIQILISALGFILIKALPIILTAVGKIYIDKKFEHPNWSVPATVGIFIGGLAVTGLIIKILEPHFDKLDNLVRLSKPTPYIDKYGEDFKKPTFEQFDLIPEDYYKFNRAFRTDPTFPVLGTWIIAFLTAFKVTEERNWKVFLIVVAIIAPLSLIVYFFIKKITLYIDQKRPHFDKIKKYNEAVKIYEAIAKEIRERQ